MAKQTHAHNGALQNMNPIVASDSGMQTLNCDDYATNLETERLLTL